MLAEHDGLEQLGEPKDRGSLAKDDRLDVLAMAVAYWNESMARDEAKVQAEHRSKMQDLELRKFMESFTGAGSSSTWSSLKDHLDAEDEGV